MHTPTVVNLFSAQLEPDDQSPAGFGAPWRSIGPELGASMLGATIYECAPGDRMFPYHYEHGDEEWVIVLSGTPTLRHPGGELALAPGDAVAFPAGPDGAHQVANRSGETVRLLMLSTLNYPKVIVYADTDKIGVRVRDRSDNANLPRSAHVDYWEGEI